MITLIFVLKYVAMSGKSLNIIFKLSILFYILRLILLRENILIIIIYIFKRLIQHLILHLYVFLAIKIYSIYCIDHQN